MNSAWKWQDRDRLFYDHWEWSFSFRLEGAWVTRQLDHEVLDRRSRSNYSFGRTSEEQVQNLHHWIDFFRARTEPHKRCISYNWIYLYTNSSVLIDDICALPYIDSATIHRARVTQPRDVIMMKNPQHRYRSYFREKSVDRSNVKSLQQYLAINTHLRTSQGLTSSMRWLDEYPNQHSWWSRRYHYVDHDDPRDLTFLQMVVPGIVRCTLPIQKSAAK